jgi:hypothetical protein
MLVLRIFGVLLVITLGAGDYLGRILGWICRDQGSPVAVLHRPRSCSGIHYRIDFYDFI